MFLGRLGGGMGAMFGPQSQFLKKRLMAMGAGPRPGMIPGEQPNVPTGGRGEPLIPARRPVLLGRPDTGVLGELGMTPEQWVQNRRNRDTSFDELQNLVDTRERVNRGLIGQRIGSMGQGAGFGPPEDPLRKLLAQRLAAMG